MTLYKIYDCSFGVTIGGVNYDFVHVQNMTIENPEKTRLVRGANAGNKTGLVFKEGIKDAKTITVTVMDMPLEVHNLLKAAYDNKDRMDAYCISNVDGSSKIAKNAVLSQEPQQLTVDDSPESLNVALVFESYDVSEVHKS